MRLIDSDKLETHLDSYGESCVSFSDIANAPTVEAEPVIHAHWKDGKYIYDHCRCSNCKDWIIDNDDVPFYKYCPNCGAKMDEVIK